MAVRLFSSRRPQLDLSSIDLSPAAIEAKVLGVFSRLAGSTSDEELREEFGAPVKEVEQKANELIEEIKNLPQEQAEVVKKQLLKTVCQPAPEATEVAEEEIGE